MSAPTKQFHRLSIGGNMPVRRAQRPGHDDDNGNDNDSNDLHDISNDQSTYSNINLNNSSHNHHFNRYHRHREFRRVTAPPTSYEGLYLFQLMFLRTNKRA